LIKETEVYKKEFKESSSRVKQQSRSNSKPNVQPSKSRIWKNTPNPVDELMNIDGERSSRQRQKILSILRKELYEKEIRRINRDQLKAERIHKKRENERKEVEEEYRKITNLSKVPQPPPEDVDSWETRSSIVNPSGRSTQQQAPHLSQMITLMNKYNYAAAGLQNKIPFKPKGSVNFGAPYFTRAGDLAEGNFQPPEKIEIPELVQEVLDSHHRMYEMTIHSAKQMGKKYKEFLKEQNKRQENKTKHKSSKVK